MRNLRKRPWLKISDREVEQIREHFGKDPHPPVSLLATTFKVSIPYMSDILKLFRRQDTSLNRRVNRRK